MNNFLVFALIEIYRTPSRAFLVLTIIDMRQRTDKQRVHVASSQQQKKAAENSGLLKLA